MNGIWNLSSTDKKSGIQYLELEIQYLESGIHFLESLTWRKPVEVGQAAHDKLPMMNN